MPRKPFLTIMKKLLFALSMLAFVISAVPQARGADVSVDFFYNNLSGGNWIEVEGYGYGWQPDISVSDPNWRPYTDGYWAYTDYGWTWISYEDFGWATYHYGRWADLADYGWVWFPGSDLDWGPAWVSWRTGGDYIGWAPLPPRGPEVVYEGQPIGASVDIQFDIGLEYYNFCDIRFIGEPVLRDRIFPPTQNITYITNTVNVTNITVQNNVVYNYGPDYNVVNTYSSRPIQRLTIERQSAADLSAAVRSGTLTKVQGNKLLVAAPPKIAKAPPTIAPPKVKAKVAQPKVEHGWKGVPNRAELEQKIKKENPKSVPPPTRAAARPSGNAMPAVGASPPAAGGSPAGAAPAPRGKPGRILPGATAPPAGVSPSPGKPRPGARPRPGATVTPAAPPTRSSPPPSGRARPTPGARPPLERGTPPGRPAERPTPPSAIHMTPPPAEHGRPPARRLGESPSPGAGVPGNVPPQGRERGPERERFGTPPPAGAGSHEGRAGGPPPAIREHRTPPPSGEVPGARERGQGAYGQLGGPPRGGAPAKAERSAQPERGKKKAEKESPPPGPQ